jgi:hypothetical protein
VVNSGIRFCYLSAEVKQHFWCLETGFSQCLEISGKKSKVPRTDILAPALFHATKPVGLTCRARGFEAAIPGHGHDEFWLNRGYLPSGKHTKAMENGSFIVDKNLVYQKVSHII